MVVAQRRLDISTCGLSLCLSLYFLLLMIDLGVLRDLLLVGDTSGNLSQRGLIAQNFNLLTRVLALNSVSLATVRWIYDNALRGLDLLPS